MIMGDGPSDDLRWAMLIATICSLACYRSCPTKLDCDVKLALCDAEVDMAKYPHVYQWLTTVKSFSEQEQRRLTWGGRGGWYMYIKLGLYLW